MSIEEEPEPVIKFEVDALDLEINRGYQLNTTNDLKLFMEEFETICKNGRSLKEEKDD